jgi:hypothetical protein
MNIFVVNTPLQFINVIEAKSCFDVSDSEALLIVVCLGNRVHQLRDVVNELEWAEVLWLESEEEGLHCKNVWTIMRLFMWFAGCRRFVRQLAELKKRHRTIGKIFLGNYLMDSQLHIANVFMPEKVILLDDGNASLTTAQLRQNGVSPFESRQGCVARCKYLIKKHAFRFKLFDIARVTFFTTYDFEVSAHDVTVKNDFSKIRKALLAKSYRDEVWFVGAPLVELGIMGFDDFCLTLDKVLDYYAGRKVSYVKHPGETLRETEDYLRGRRVNICCFSKPLELVFLKESELPKVVATFYSSALHNLGHVLGNTIEFNAFRIDVNFIKETFRPRISAVYDYFESKKSINIKVVSF